MIISGPDLTLHIKKIKYLLIFKKKKKKKNRNSKFCFLNNFFPMLDLIVGPIDQIRSNCDLTSGILLFEFSSKLRNGPASYTGFTSSFWPELIRVCLIKFKNLCK